MKYLEKAGKLLTAIGGLLPAIGKLLTAIGGLLCLVILGWGLTGCDNRPSVVKPTSGPTFVADKEDVKRLCDFFATNAIETLAIPAYQGNVNLYADRPGVPSKLRDAAKAFYRDGLTSDPVKNKSSLEVRYSGVLWQCTNSDTGWTRP